MPDIPYNKSSFPLVTLYHEVMTRKPKEDKSAFGSFISLLLKLFGSRNRMKYCGDTDSLY